MKKTLLTLLLIVSILMSIGLSGCSAKNNAKNDEEANEVEDVRNIEEADNEKEETKLKPEKKQEGEKPTAGKVVDSTEEHTPAEGRGEVNNLGEIKKLGEETLAKLRAMAKKLPERKETTQDDLSKEPLEKIECEMSEGDHACFSKLKDLKGVWYSGDESEGGLGFFIEIQGADIIRIGYPFSEMIYHIEVKEREETTGHVLLRTEASDYETDEAQKMTIEIKRVNFDTISFKIDNYEPSIVWYSANDLEEFNEFYMESR